MRLNDSLQILLVEPTEHAIIIEFSDGTYAEFGVNELARIRPNRDRAPVKKSPASEWGL
jgi:hypothetical protein